MAIVNSMRELPLFAVFVAASATGSSESVSPPQPASATASAANWAAKRTRLIRSDPNPHLQAFKANRGTGRLTLKGETAGPRTRLTLGAESPRRAKAEADPDAARGGD